MLQGIEVVAVSEGSLLGLRARGGGGRLRGPRRGGGGGGEERQIPLAHDRFDERHFRRVEGAPVLAEDIVKPQRRLRDGVCGPQLMAGGAQRILQTPITARISQRIVCTIRMYLYMNVCMYDSMNDSARSGSAAMQVRSKCKRLWAAHSTKFFTESQLKCVWLLPATRPQLRNATGQVRSGQVRSLVVWIRQTCT